MLESESMKKSYSRHGYQPAAAGVMALGSASGGGIIFGQQLSGMTAANEMAKTVSCWRNRK